LRMTTYLRSSSDLPPEDKSEENSAQASLQPLAPISQEVR
jgi:hypothetical protein